MIAISGEDLGKVIRASSKRGQIAWLKRNRVDFIPGADGWPVVLVANLERALSCGKRPEETDTSTHNFGALMRGAA